jgi:beta-glucosidase
VIAMVGSFAARRRVHDTLRSVTRADDGWRPLLPTEPVEFPPDFAWGVASSAFQAEGGEVPNDWVDAAASGRVPPNPGNGFWERAEQDFALVASLGFRHYRLSVEWSRVEPERGRFDGAALDRYRRICDAARAAGVTPWVNLFHFTHPRWFAAAGGFLEIGNHADFLRYVETVGRALAPHARHFHIQNESMVYVLAGYLMGENPPFLKSRDAAHAMTRHVLALQADGVRALKSVDPDLLVAGIEVYLDARPRDPADPAQCAAAERFDAWYHGTLLEALATGWVRLPDREPEEIPHLRGALDLYGFNYYSSTAFGPKGTGSFSDRDDAPRDEMRRCVFPRGLEEGLLRVARALPGLPLMVTENGVPTTDETFRIRYVAAHLAALARARAQGADVRGYFHWTAVDNYEWHQGYSKARFGLIGFDPMSRERSVKASGRWMADLIARGRLEPDRIP